MIIPSGKIRQQINQGKGKYDSIFNNPDDPLARLLQKYAITGMDVPGEKPPQITPQLSQTMNESNNAGMTTKVPQKPDPAQPPMGNASAVQPNGTSKSPASQFLQPKNEEANMGDVLRGMLMKEQQKIRNFIGNDFGLNLSRGNKGGIQMTITPPQGQPITDPTKFLAEVLRYIGGQAEPDRMETPSVADGGPISVEYRPEGMPMKVQKT